VSPTRSRDIGTAAETAVVRHLRPNGFPHAERRALRGVADAGDIAGTPGICWEIKGGAAARTASDLLIWEWLHELAAEMVNAAADVGVLVLQRAGVGPANAGRWWAIMPAGQVVALARPGVEPDVPLDRLLFPVRMLLADAVSLLRAAGYGSDVSPDSPAGGAASGRRPPRRGGDHA
jgi:hypothetical protein